MFIEVDRAIREGANILILSDRGVDEYHVAMPSLLALSGLQQHLVRTKKRTSVAIILETGEPREVHHFATLLGYGACAINPYLAHESIRQLIDTDMLQKDYYAAVDDYNHAVLSGIVKVASKMGISTIQSYQGAKIFEAIGLKEAFIDKYFTDTVSRIGGIGIEEIAQDYVARHSQAFDPLGLEVDLTLNSIGQHKSKSGGEKHLYNPQTIHMLQQSARRGDYEMFKKYTDMVNEEGAHINLRGQLEFKYPKKGIPVDEVESVDSIVTRFKTGAMSYGSISKEAHETLAIAMNQLHGKSNSGEGGEEIERLDTNRCSAIKQVASGRFGVTSRYLVSAREIQIKMAQGAKPGEGGHLPGGKVYPWIAKTRHSTPGVSLISPPPHHDIYSIEDLAQLIYDCKNANKDARISVKLVSEAGVGTVAAGVAKAGAGLILISGYDGGTGAAPRSSIHNAGLPWELGLAETHQTLIQNGPSGAGADRDGRQADERPGCGYCRDPWGGGIRLRHSASGNDGMRHDAGLQPGYLPGGGCHPESAAAETIHRQAGICRELMRFIAQNLREYMARLGVRTVDELVGRTDLLKVREDATSDRAATLDLKQILYNPYEGTKTPVTFNPKKRYGL